MFSRIKKILKLKSEYKENKTISVKYFNMEIISINGFCNFCRNNIPLIITVSITLFFTYGIKLFWYNIGIDTEIFMTNTSGALKWSIALGRFGYALLSKVWYIKEFNPFTAFFITFCLIWFFTISWCYIIAIFSKDTIKNNKLIPFALVFMTMPVWAEQFYFLLQTAETALIITLCPYVIYFLFKWFLDDEKIKIIYTFILLVFMTSVYQAIIPMFCCGVFICFVLLQEHSEYEPHIYRNLCLKLFITLIGSLVVYFFIDRIIISAFHIEKPGYLDPEWTKKTPIRQIILRILLLGYTITIGQIPAIQNITNPIMLQYTRAGMLGIENVTNVSRLLGNIFLLPVVVVFLAKIYTVMRRIPRSRQLLYIFAGIGIPLSIMFLAIIIGNKPVARSLWSLPLAFAFMLFYLIRTYKKKVAFIITCLSLLIAVYQAESTAQLFYSDQMRYNEDVRFAYELNNLIISVQPENEKLPVVLVGRYQASSRFQRNFLKGEVIGYSVFEVAGKYSDTTLRGLSFMKSLGINFDIPDEARIERACKEAVSMPPYPDPGCVKRMQDCIVVRISETLYDYIESTLQ